MTLNEYIAENGNKEIEMREDGTVRILEDEGPWKPECEEKYYTIYDCGSVETFKWVDCLMDDLRKEMGNVFRTEAEAERTVHRLKARKKFLDAGGHEGPIKPNTQGWFACLVKVSAAILTPEYTLEPRHHCAVTPTFVAWFESEEYCQKAIDSLTDDEKAALCWIGKER